MPISAENNAIATDEESASSRTKPLFGLGYRTHAVLSIGAYGELKFGGHEASGGWKNGFDAQRIVLLPTYQITDNIIFNAEIEFEHGGIAEDADDKLTGAIELEQAYVDFMFNEHFNWRSPGVDVVPFGFINLFHEPTQFYSVNRPELDDGLIPTTWFEGSTSIFGKIVNNLNYQLQINTGLEDIGQNGGVPDDGSPYEAGISGTEALDLARTPIGDFNQAKNAPGFALRLSYTPPFAPGLNGSSSVFFTPNVTPRGAYGDEGNSLGQNSVTMLDTEVRYRVPRTGLELRGEVVDVIIGAPTTTVMQKIMWVNISGVSRSKRLIISILATTCITAGSSCRFTAIHTRICRLADSPEPMPICQPVRVSDNFTLLAWLCSRRHKSS
jgi:hypothetical protein